MTPRDLAQWRVYPHLRVREAATLAGISQRELETRLGEMEVRTIGRIRFVTTDSFRRWIGETVEEVRQAETVSPEVRRKVARIVRGMG